MPEYRTPGVYIEEISSGPRPVQASSTTETGFVAVIDLPTQFVPGGGSASGMYLPGPSEDVSMSWGRANAFRKLLADGGAPAAPAKAKGKGKAGPPAAGASSREAQPAAPARGQLVERGLMQRADRQDARS